MKRSMSFFMCIVVAFTFMGGFFFDSFAVTAEAASYKTPYYYKQLSEKEQGCYDVTLNVWEGNDRARKFYENCGLTVRETFLEYPL